jgi:hypothetical protein
MSAEMEVVAEALLQKRGKLLPELRELRGRLFAHPRECSGHDPPREFLTS